MPAAHSLHAGFGWELNYTTPDSILGPPFVILAQRGLSEDSQRLGLAPWIAGTDHTTASPQLLLLGFRLTSLFPGKKVLEDLKPQGLNPASFTSAGESRELLLRSLPGSRMT